MHYITLSYPTATAKEGNATFHWATLHCIHYTHYITLPHTTPHHTKPQHATQTTTTPTTTLHYTTLPYITLHQTHCTSTSATATTLVSYTTPQVQIHFTTPTATAAMAALHQTTFSSCGWGYRPGDHCKHCNHSQKRNSNHLSVHQWIRSAIHASQQLTSPILSYLWNFRHRLVRCYWYLSTYLSIDAYGLRIYIFGNSLCDLELNDFWELKQWNHGFDLSVVWRLFSHLYRPFSDPPSKACHVP